MNEAYINRLKRGLKKPEKKVTKEVAKEIVAQFHQEHPEVKASFESLKLHEWKELPNNIKFIKEVTEQPNFKNDQWQKPYLFQENAIELWKKPSALMLYNPNLNIETYLPESIIPEIVNIPEPILEIATKEVKSSDGYTPFPFQIEDTDKAYAANLRCIFNWEMGCGKTIADCIIIAKWLAEIEPFVIVCKTALSLQLWHEVFRWTGLYVQTIENGKDKPYKAKNLKGYIVSFDLLPKVQRHFEKIDPKCIFIDECQHIKNQATKRAKTLQQLCINAPHVIATSGTPIKNSAAEYWVILNIVRPDLFPSYRQYLEYWVELKWTGNAYKYGGIKAHKLEEFYNLTKDFIFRRTRAEVLPELPKIFRSFRYADLGKDVQDAYDRELDGFVKEYDSSGGKMGPGTSVIAYLQRMRHLTGIAKVKPTVQYVEDFLEDTDRKIALFVHHEDVHKLLKGNLEKLGQNPISLTSDLAPQERQAAIEKWRLDIPENRIMILSTLASGEGLNLQFCSDMVMVERQWNPANEEQCEARFPRPGSTADKINAVYMCAIGTIDEFLAEMVEDKRAIVRSTLDGKEVQWDEDGLMKELAEKLIASSKKKFKIAP